MNADGEALEWLMHWYRAQRDGDWQHQQGIKIGTLDNPGWYVDIDLSGTHEEGRTLEKTRIENSEHDWLFFEVQNNLFRGRGGPENLGELIRAFARFVDEVAGVRKLVGRDPSFPYRRESPEKKRTRPTWGESVRVKLGAPAAMRPGTLASVCGIDEIRNEVRSTALEAPIGSAVYLIEFSDGVSVELPEAWLESDAT